MPQFHLSKLKTTASSGSKSSSIQSPISNYFISKATNGSSSSLPEQKSSRGKKRRKSSEGDAASAKKPPVPLGSGDGSLLTDKQLSDGRLSQKTLAKLNSFLFESEMANLEGSTAQTGHLEGKTAHTGLLEGSTAHTGHLQQSLSVIAPHVGSSNITPRTGSSNITPRTGSSNITPRTGSSKTTPRTGSSKTTPQTGSSKTTPQTGSSKTTPQTGSSKTTPHGSSSTVSPSSQPLWAKHKRTKSLEDHGSKGRSTELGGSGQKLTPLEQQFVSIKEQHPDAVLFVECGYKYRFFGEDAEIAARELNIYCHMDHNFMTASIPTHRLHVHVRRLVAKGFKVGVVKQTETAALKAAGDNRSAPFTRQLSALYTTATLIGEDVDGVEEEDGESGKLAPSNYLLCICDQNSPRNSNSSTKIAMVAIQPSTGDMIYDEFHDGDDRLELEMRVSHIQPVEVLSSNDLTPASKHLLSALTSASVGEDRMRQEALPSSWFTGPQVTADIINFFRQNARVDEVVERTVGLPDLVLGCLHALLRYLTDFKLDSIIALSCSMSHFQSATKALHVNAATLRNLDVFRCNGQRKGSLLWFLDHTKTQFGSRLLAQWLAKPLTDASEIEARLDAVSEFSLGRSSMLHSIRCVVEKLPDVEKGLGAVLHKKSSPWTFYSTCHSLELVEGVLSATLTREASDSTIQSTLIKSLLTDTARCLLGISKWTRCLDEIAAKAGDKTNLFKDISAWPKLAEIKDDIVNLQSGLQLHLKEIRQVLCMPKLEYMSLLNTEFLIEVRNTQLGQVPKSWTRFSMTKTLSRFHTPFVEESIQKLSQCKERLLHESHQAWLHFLRTFEEDYQKYRKAVKHLAVFDCLSSLAIVAEQHNLTRPTIEAAGGRLIIEQGRHPVVEILMDEQQQYVPNNTHLETEGERCCILTGPNMGGKSSYIRQVAVIALLAHIGSHVPADSAVIGVLDGIYTRMGAYDNLLGKRHSTFMTELTETTDILNRATERSLVILDELGRGTSTHDGAAIAYATLHHLVEEKKCLSLFVTHYPSVTELAAHFPQHVGNYCMAYVLDKDAEHDTEAERNDDGEQGVLTGDDLPTLTFLYLCERGVAESSYGLNVARLAGIHPHIITKAAHKARQLQQHEACHRLQSTVFRKIWNSERYDASTIQPP